MALPSDQRRRYRDAIRDQEGQENKKDWVSGHQIIHVKEVRAADL